MGGRSACWIPSWASSQTLSLLTTSSAALGTSFGYCVCLCWAGGGGEGGERVAQVLHFCVSLHCYDKRKLKIVANRTAYLRYFVLNSTTISYDEICAPDTRRGQCGSA